MKIRELVEDFKAKKVQNTKVAPNAVDTFISENIKFTTYTSFQTKREIAQTIVSKSINNADGYKYVDSVSQFLSFIMAMLIAHTDLTVEDAYEDYDALCETGLLQPIIANFKQDYDECEVIMKMTAADELQTNATPAIIAQFLNNINEKLGDFGQVLSEKINDLDLGKVLGSAGINDENLASIKELLNIKK